MIGYPQDMLDMFLDASVEGEDIEQHTGFKLSEAKVCLSRSRRP